EYSGFWKQFDCWDWSKRPRSIRLLPPSFMAKYRKSHKPKQPHFIPAHPMEWPNYMHSGWWSTTGKHTGCLPAMVFCSIMSLRFVERLSFHVKFPELWQRLPSEKRKCSTSEIWKPKETGDMPVIMWRPCG